MSGHNKWTKIKHKKGAEDAKKSKLFSMLAKQISVHMKASGGDSDAPNVRAIIAKARAANMPNENIERALSRARDTGLSSFEELVFELYAPCGAAVIARAVTDNCNRTVAEIKHLLSKHATALAENGSALWAFVKEGGNYHATNQLPLSEHEAEKLRALINVLEEHDDIEAVYTNGAL